MKNNNVLTISAILSSLFMTGCKFNQPMFAGAGYAGWTLLAISLVLMGVVMKKYI